MIYLNNRILSTIEMTHHWHLDEYFSWINDRCPINTSVIILDLQESNLTSIVNQINNLPNLSTLNLVNNDITNLPDEIGDLKNLKNLYLCYNNISKLPSTFESLDLEYFECQFNNLTELPCLDNMISMKALKLNSNYITSVNINLNLIPNIEYIDFFGNPNIEFNQPLKDLLGDEHYWPNIIITDDEFEFDEEDLDDKYRG
jgi:hypothetical protein